MKSPSSPSRQAARNLAATATLGGFVCLAATFQLPYSSRFAMSDTTDTVAPGAPGGSGVPMWTAPGIDNNQTPNPTRNPSGANPALPGAANPNGVPNLPPAPGTMPGATGPNIPVPGQLPPDPRVSQAFARAVAAQQQKHWKEAIAAYREVLHLAPQAVPAHLNLALVYLQNNDDAAALSHLKKAVQLAPQEPQPRVMLAQTYMQLRRPADAYEQWTQIAKAAKGDHGQAAFAAGSIAFEELKKLPDAEYWLKKAAAQSGGKAPEVSLLLGRVLEAQGKKNEAAHVLAPAAKQFPKVPELGLALAQAQWDLKRFDAAASTLQTLEKNIPAALNGGAPLNQVRMMLARAYLQQKKFGPATSTLRAAYTALPKGSPMIDSTKSLFAQSLASLAQSQEKSKDLKNATATWNEAITLLPDNPFGYLQRARLLQRQGKSNDALADFQKALKYVPSDPNALLGAAMLEEESGKNDQALTHWKQLIDAQPKYGAAYYNVLRLGSNQKTLPQQLIFIENRLQKNPERREAYDAMLQLSKQAGKSDVGRAWVEKMSQRFPKAKAPKQALIAFNRDNKPEAKPTPKPIPTSVPTAKPTAAPASVSTPAPHSTPKTTAAEGMSTPSSKPTTHIEPMSTPMHKTEPIPTAPMTPRKSALKPGSADVPPA